MTSGQRYGLLAAILLIAIVHVATLMNAPAPFVDEAWLASRADGFLKTGYGVGELDAGVFERYPGYERYFWLLGPWLHSLPLRIAGINLFALRLESLLFGIVLLGIIYFIARRLGSYRCGLIAVLLGGFSLPFTISTHLARQDIVIATLGFGAIALQLYDNHKGLPVKA